MIDFFQRVNIGNYYVPTLIVAFVMKQHHRITKQHNKMACRECTDRTLDEKSIVSKSKLGSQFEKLDCGITTMMHDCCIHQTNETHVVRFTSRQWRSKGSAFESYHVSYRTSSSKERINWSASAWLSMHIVMPRHEQYTLLYQAQSTTTNENRVEWWTLRQRSNQSILSYRIAYELHCNISNRIVSYRIERTNERIRRIKTATKQFKVQQWTLQIDFELIKHMPLREQA